MTESEIAAAEALALANLNRLRAFEQRIGMPSAPGKKLVGVLCGTILALVAALREQRRQAA